ncbi:hypothetical protein Pint_15275 [Pistacia integerrima]|uniref:Uncharacterized protein n=1 Tax=Pistacia integerrima TaxID=434235 RepID=A0ACC0ZE59_9ROSI|nr:hypothetical protein Pint_15275 [Pistacia integerrima]
MDAILSGYDTLRSKIVCKSLSSSKKTCSHSMVLRGLCVYCGKNMNDGFGVGFDFLLDGLRFSNHDLARWKELNSKNLFSQRKLQLVLDLDHTLLHSKDIHKLTRAEEYLKRRADSSENMSDGDLFNLDNDFIVKLRPCIRTFLKEVSSMFELYIYTMGSRCYAEEVAMLLDPKCQYFIKSRIISRDDSKQTQKKSLDFVLGQERGIVILDDTESVWNEHKDNLIVMGKYNYFRDGEIIKRSFSEKKTDESETNGVLANVLGVLRQVHGFFFEDPTNLGGQDARTLLRKIRGRILMGCTLFFKDVEDELIILRSRAEEMGATCKTILDSSVSHLVSSKNTIEGYKWAEVETRYLVHPRWIYAAYYLWYKQPEYLYFPV